jgi:flavin reductase (DIM6/NTAB) family NADH-FMN oxidoreductase RutF
MELRHDMVASGVNIVTAAHEGKRGGLAVAWATQVAKGHVLICVGKQSATRELILTSKAFGLSALREDQLELSRLFGSKSSRDVDKFAGLATHTLETGSPLLDDCGRRLDCRVEEVYDRGHGKLIVGRVVAAELTEQRFEPLIYREEDYH